MLTQTLQKIQVTNAATGATAVGTVADECPGCNGRDLGMFTHLFVVVPDIDIEISADMTPGLFEKLGSLDQGVLQINWKYI